MEFVGLNPLDSNPCAPEDKEIAPVPIAKRNESCMPSESIVSDENVTTIKLLHVAASRLHENVDVVKLLKEAVSKLEQ